MTHSPDSVIVEHDLQPLAYARPMVGTLSGEALAAFRQYVPWAIVMVMLSAGCVGVSFLAMMSRGDAMMAAVHATVFISTLAIATFASLRLSAAWRLHGAAGVPSRPWLDGLAALGLVAGAATPAVYAVSEVAAAGVVMAGFLALAASTYRHQLHYDAVATLASACLGRPARGWRGLGYTKMIVEGLWLACCGIGIAVGLSPLADNGWASFVLMLATSAIIGCVAYGVICIVALVLHCRLVGVAAKRQW